MIQQPIGEYSADLIPIDNDLISMEIPYGFKEYNVDGDNSSLLFLARGLMKMQALYGEFKTIKYIGFAAEKVVKILEGLNSTLKSKFSGNTKDIYNEIPEVQKVLIIDREVDMITPFMTQLTYEGLMDEFYRIENNLLSLKFFGF